MIKEYINAKQKILDFFRFSGKTSLIDFGFKVSLKNKAETSEQIVIESLILKCLEIIQEEKAQEIYQIQKEIASLELKLAEIYSTDEIKILNKILEEIETKDQALVVVPTK